MGVRHLKLISKEGMQHFCTVTIAGSLAKQLICTIASKDPQSNQTKITENNTKIIAWHEHTHTLFFCIKHTYYKAKIVATSADTLHVLLFPSMRSYMIEFSKAAQKLPRKNNELLVKNDDTNILCSPLAGRVIRCAAHKNQIVKKNQPLLIIESMKMENEICAPINGRIKEVKIQEGTMVESHQELIIFEPLIEKKMFFF